MMPRYIHDLPGWPVFHWDAEALSGALAEVHRQERRLRGRLETFAIEVIREVETDALTREALSTSTIEGEVLDPSQVRSSVATRLNMDTVNLPSPASDLEGIVEITLDATGTNEEPMTEERLFAWHSLLFPRGRSGLHLVQPGAWRTGAVQVVSGPVGRERVHFEAPGAGRVPGEMKAFLDWFNTTSDTNDLLRAGIAHLWFVTIHPFEDGNGRIARALTNMVLGYSQDSPVRFYSMSGRMLRRDRTTTRPWRGPPGEHATSPAGSAGSLVVWEAQWEKHGSPQARQRPGQPSGRG